MKNRYLTWLLVLLVLLDLAHTFAQSYYLPLDGDLAAIVLPSAWYQPVLHDPFGWAVLSKNAVYAAPNRFFAHAAMVGYWRQVPRWLQAVAAPIDSIYLAAALFNAAVQALLLGLLAAHARRLLPTLGRAGSWLTAALLTPLFQLTSFGAQMGILSRSLTYTFFYAFPLALLLLWLLPFGRAASRAQPLRLPAPVVGLWAMLAVVLAFNGAVVTAAVAVLGLLMAGQGAAQRYRTGQWPAWWSGQALGLGLWLGALCAYSLFIGRNNAENSHLYTLGALYQRLPQGIWNALTGKLGLPLLVLFVVLNGQLVRRFTRPTAEGQRVRQLLRWMAVFAGLYLLLLPLGGHRPYRDYLVRNDSALPVLLGLLLAYGVSTLHLLGNLPARARRWYLGGVLALTGVFVGADYHLWYRGENNHCERAGLQLLAQSPAPVVRLPADCKVMSWVPLTDPQQSATNAELLYYWSVTPTRKLYYQ
ncbi:hypothetical protein Q5H93_21270 [Hymenobacter sp. ASUV-10]|uniref:DUF2029 domain-containing protein n=1 Tax=Hymenobacter aranciens TaxID=3063996 RepID=A0ABT9BGA1_9BACT|nr:hypothetical protein [Hymenobacter sp. ASUV-10]MDO7877289.1 hypothetical protein [Hymenobacter sp. ASUV-10]